MYTGGWTRLLLFSSAQYDLFAARRPTNCIHKDSIRLRMRSTVCYGDTYSFVCMDTKTNDDADAFSCGCGCGLGGMKMQESSYVGMTIVMTFDVSATAGKCVITK